MHIQSQNPVVFRLPLRFKAPPRPARYTLARPTPVGNPCDFGQRSAATIKLRPWRRLLAPKQSEVSPPPRRPVSVEDAKPSPAAPVRPVPP